MSTRAVTARTAVVVASVLAILAITGTADGFAIAARPYLRDFVRLVLGQKEAPLPLAAPSEFVPDDIYEDVLLDVQEEELRRQIQAIELSRTSERERHAQHLRIEQLKRRLVELEKEPGGER